MKRISSAVLGGATWKFRYPRRIATAYADCCHADKTIRIESGRDGLEFVNLLIHEALHAMLPSEWINRLPGKTKRERDEEEEVWVLRSASELTRLLERFDLLSEELR